MVLVDRYGRPVTHLRISVTFKCNHDCVFCHREGILYSGDEELSADEWSFVAKVAVELGIREFKLTGGEPLIRRDIVEIVEGITRHGGKTSMVTNGSLLEHYAHKLAEAGLERVNVSLHSLNKDTFYKITHGNLDKVIRGIEAAINAGLKVKIDYLVLSLNVGEYKKIIEFAEKYGLDLNIIELIPIGLSKDEYNNLHHPLEEIKKYLEEHSIKKYVREFQLRPTYVLPSGIQVSLIKGYGNPFLCAKCTRLRATPDGFLKTCIYRNDLIDMKPAIKERNEEKLKQVFMEAVKKREPFFKFKDPELYRRIWSSNNIEISVQ